MKPLSTLAVLLAVSVAAHAQSQTPPASPELRTDRSVTFRFRAPNAKAVQLALEGQKPAPMRKDSSGTWSLTTAPLAPDLYGYSFVVDGQALMDPSNWRTKPNLISPQSAVYVAGSQPWDEADVPHGDLHRHFYRSAAIGEDSEFYVYTPPGYDGSKEERYPVLYLLHGFSDEASAWTTVGRVNFILDNLIAQGKAKPMIVAMPLGYGTMEMVRRGWAAWADQALQKRNFQQFGVALLTELLPRVEGGYRVAEGREARAIAGLSMGGAEALLTGLNNLDSFAWVGAFSSGGLPSNFQADFPALDKESSSRLRLLWIACGVDDDLIYANRDLKRWLGAKEIRYSDIETPGVHSWLVWRRNVADFAALLFR
jgi:enterochelin esterase family protein